MSVLHIGPVQVLAVRSCGHVTMFVLGDLWMPLLCFIPSAVSLGVGIKRLVRKHSQWAEYWTVLMS